MIKSGVKKASLKTPISDKDDYRTTLLALYNVLALTARINQLTKTFLATEDLQLKHLLWPVLDFLKYSLVHIPAGKQQKILDFTDGRVISVVNYCSAVLASVKPQWQIIAEAQGWHPSLHPHSGTRSNTVRF